VKVRKIMRCIVVAGPAEHVRIAAERMRDHGLGALPVVDGGRLVGIITDRDIAIRYVARVEPQTGWAVARYMTSPVLCCHETQTVEEAAAIMADHQIWHLPVLDDVGGLVGLLSLGDIAEHYSEHLAGEVLGEIVEAR
jgi:CBS domain-containing protein